jgi:TPR repeat protein
MSKIASLLAAVVALGLTAPAAAGPIDDAVEARLKGDYPRALKLLRPLADQGDAAAQSNLGFMYATGMGVPQDRAEAAKWYQRAAEQGRANAQFNLGRMYAVGQGVPKSEADALKWFRAAAEQATRRRSTTSASCMPTAVAYRATAPRR